MAWAVAFFSDVPVFRERSNLTEGVKAFLTLGVGLVAYFVPAAWLSADRKHLQRTLVLINLAGVMIDRLVFGAGLLCDLQPWRIPFHT